MPIGATNVHDKNLQMGGNDDDQSIFISIHRLQILDRLEVMKKQECTTYRVRDYLKDNPTEKPDAIDAACRYQMVQWCFTLVDHANLDRQTVCIAISYLDRFLSSGTSRARRVAEDRDQFQLATMTALYMAIKVFEPKLLDAAQLAELSSGKFQSTDIIRMESEMLLDLNWRMNGPTAVSFLVYFVALLRAHSKNGDDITINYNSVLADARYQIELSVTHYTYAVAIHPSTVAVAALVNSIRGVITSKNTSRRITNQLLAITGMAIDVKSSQLRKITQCMNKMQYEMINSNPCFRKRPSHAVWTIAESSLSRKERKLATGCTQQNGINGEGSSPISCV